MEKLKILILLMSATLCVLLTGCNGDQDIVEPVEKETIHFEVTNIINPENVEFGFVKTKLPDPSFGYTYTQVVQTNYLNGELIFKTSNLSKLYIEEIFCKAVNSCRETEFKRVDDYTFSSEEYGMTISKISDNSIKVTFDELKLHDYEDPLSANRIYNGREISNSDVFFTVLIVISDPSKKLKENKLTIRRTAFKEGMFEITASELN